MKHLIKSINLVVKYSYLSNLLLSQRKLSTSIFSLTANQSSSWGSKKKHRNIKLNLQHAREMADPKTEEILLPLRQNVKEQVSYLF